MQHTESKEESETNPTHLSPGHSLPCFLIWVALLPIWHLWEGLQHCIGLMLSSRLCLFNTHVSMCVSGQQCLMRANQGVLSCFENLSASGNQKNLICLSALSLLTVVQLLGTEEGIIFYREGNIWCLFLPPSFFLRQDEIPWTGCS